MTWVFGGLILISVVFAALNGRISDVSVAALGESAKAVELVIGLAGSICLWSGLMRIADKSGLTRLLCHWLSPLTGLLFKGMDRESPAAKAISMNLTANLLGLGSAATPLGITAMREMEKDLRGSVYASNHMITFVVLNTASLQLIPTTTAMLRMQAGSAAPLEILPAVWVSSLVSVTGGVMMAQILSKLWRIPR